MLSVPAGTNQHRLVVTPTYNETADTNHPLTYTLLFSPLYEVGTHVTATVVIHDTTPTNYSPRLQLSAALPTDGPFASTLLTPGPVELRADAFDPDGSIAEVELFFRGQSLAKLAGDPSVVGRTNHLRHVWTNPPPGLHKVTGVVRDDLEATWTNTATVQIFYKPRITLHVTPTNQILFAPVHLGLRAELDDPLGWVTNVTFRGEGFVRPIAEFASPPYAATVDLADTQTHWVGVQAVTRDPGSYAHASAFFQVFDAAAGPVVRVFASRPEASEPDVPGEFTFVRIGQDMSQPLTVPFRLTNSRYWVPLPRSAQPTAKPGQDYVPLPDEVVIPAGNEQVSLTVRPIDDAVFAGNRGVFLQLLAVPGLQVTSPYDRGFVIIHDDETDLPATVRISGLTEGMTVPLNAATYYSTEVEDPDHTPQQLELVVNGSVVGPTSPGRHLLHGLGPGDNTIVLRATDAFGYLAETAPVMVRGLAELTLLTKTLSRDGLFRPAFRVRPEGYNYAIERSSDLVHWTGSGAMVYRNYLGEQITYPVPKEESPATYYRAVLLR